MLRDHPHFQHFRKSTESMLRGGGKSSCMFSKMLLYLYISLAIQHFYSMLLGRREGVCKKSTLRKLVKLLNIMDGITLT